MVLLVHATLQWHNIGEKQSKFLMLGDILSAPGHFNPSAIEVPANCFHERWPLPALDVRPHLGPWQGEQKRRRDAFIQRALVS
ncbi:hypothetical protein QQF64_028689 [Cirrhinus molitorella]|uniref:Uncharacterized protein n=1 Tax=Cirrhinus molitorella TaxID=172907 RepID=A0ABR3N7Q2_9TELE